MEPNLFGMHRPLCLFKRRCVPKLTLTPSSPIKHRLRAGHGECAMIQLGLQVKPSLGLVDQESIFLPSLLVSHPCQETQTKEECCWLAPAFSRLLIKTTYVLQKAQPPRKLLWESYGCSGGILPADQSLKLGPTTMVATVGWLGLRLY